MVAYAVARRETPARVAARKRRQTETPEERTARRKREARERAYARYGITLAEFETMNEAQNGLCAICDKQPNREFLDVDHCHETGKVRGLLCNKCNQALGLLGDDLSIVMRVYTYLS